MNPANHLSGAYLLGAHRHGVLLADRTERWRTVAGLARVLNRTDLASALLAAHEHGAHIPAAEPDAYGDPGRPTVIEI